MLKNSKVLMLIAHADDEIICGYPIFQNTNIEKYILLVSTDKYNKKKHGVIKGYIFLKIYVLNII